METIFRNLTPEFRRFAPEIVSAGGLILDAPSGSGRHSLYLARMGGNVLAVDIDSGRLDRLFDRRNQLGDLPGAVSVLQKDLLSDALSLPGAPFAAILNVHFLRNAFLARVSSLLSSGGLFYLETPDSRGENYLELPKKSELCGLLNQEFEFVFYQERTAGPRRLKRVSVRLLARRK